MSARQRRTRPRQEPAVLAPPLPCLAGAVVRTAFGPGIVLGLTSALSPFVRVQIPDDDAGSARWITVQASAALQAVERWPA